MTTLIDLVLKLASTILESMPRLAPIRRERREKIATYFDGIASALAAAAVEFNDGNRPWERIGELMHYLHNFGKIAGAMIKDERELSVATTELIGALNSDFRLLGGSRERTILDAITVRPYFVQYALFNAGLLKVSPDLQKQIMHSFHEFQSPVEAMSDRDVVETLARETDRIKQASGVFRAMAAEIRAGA